MRGAALSPDKLKKMSISTRPAGGQQWEGAGVTVVAGGSGWRSAGVSKRPAVPRQRVQRRLCVAYPRAGASVGRGTAPPGLQKTSCLACSLCHATSRCAAAAVPPASSAPGLLPPHVACGLLSRSRGLVSLLLVEGQAGRTEAGGIRTQQRLIGRLAPVPDWPACHRCGRDYPPWRAEGVRQTLDPLSSARISAPRASVAISGLPDGRRWASGADQLGAKVVRCHFIARPLVCLASARAARFNLHRQQVHTPLQASARQQACITADANSCASPATQLQQHLQWRQRTVAPLTCFSNTTYAPLQTGSRTAQTDSS